MKHHDIKKAPANPADYRRELIGDPQCIGNLNEINCTNTTDRQTQTGKDQHDQLKKQQGSKNANKQQFMTQMELNTATSAPREKKTETKA